MNLANAEPSNKQAAAYGTGSTQSRNGGIDFIAEDVHSEDDSYGEDADETPQDRDTTPDVNRNRNGSDETALQAQERNRNLTKKLQKSQSN